MTGDKERRLIRLASSVTPAEDPPKPEPPEPPEWLVGAGLEAWHEIAPQLFEMRVLTEVDRAALGRYCVAYAAWREAEDHIAARGKVYPVLKPDGSLKIMRKSPHVELAFEAAREMSRLESEFGLTPSARASLRVEPAHVRDSIAAKFLTGGR
jgi:P27 family predicted phage terminase small subunit